MGKTIEKRTIGTLILQIALGLLFIVGGIWTLQNGKGDEISAAIRTIFKGDAANILCVCMAIIELIAGVFLLLRLFVVLGTNLDKLFMMIILIAWIVIIVLADFVGDAGLFNSLDSGFLSFLNRFARHLIVLGAILKLKDY